MEKAGKRMRAYLSAREISLGEKELETLVSRFTKDGSKKTIKIPLTEKIRHQIHHPENKENSKYTDVELSQSIDLMRTFVETLTTTT